LLDNEPISSAKSLCAFALQAERLLVLQASSSIETQTRWGADTPTSAGQKGIASQRVTADVYRDALCASLQEILQPDFDPLTWTAGLISETAEMAPFTARKHLLKAGIFIFREFKKVTTAFNKSPFSLKMYKDVNADCFTSSSAAGHTRSNKRRI
jgi:hypothetical protein